MYIVATNLTKACFLDLRINRGHKMKGRVNLWVNLYDDLQIRPVMTEAIDSQRDDLTNVVELQDGKRFIYLRGNVSIDFCILLKSKKYIAEGIFERSKILRRSYLASHTL